MIPAAWRDIATRTLFREAASLDERRWDDWLALLTPDCEYWVPAWRTEEELSEDPQKELSHVYYASRAGLEDRILRIRTGRSPASNPLRRTTHMVSNIELIEGTNDAMEVRSSWLCQVFDPHHKTAHALFGHARYGLQFGAGGWLIRRKKTVLQNDYLPSMVDVYCL